MVIVQPMKTMTFVFLEIRAKVTYIEYFRFLQECTLNSQI